MPSVLTLLGGLAAGVCGAPKGASQVEALKKERDEMDASRREAMRQVEALESEKVALQREIQKLKKVPSSEQQVNALQAGLDAAQDKVKSLEADVRREADQGARAEQQVKALQAGLDAAQDKVKSLEVDVRREADQGARASVELCQMRKELEELAAERDGAVARAEEGQRKVTTLEKEQASLKEELASSQVKRRDSIGKITRSLSEISDKLDTAKTSWQPWNDITSAKQQLGNMQKEASDLVRGG